MGGDRFSGTYRTGRDTVRVAGFVPFVRLTPGRSVFSGAFERGRAGHVTLVRGDGSCDGTFRGSASVSGLTPTFRSHFVGRSGASVVVGRGDSAALHVDCAGTGGAVPRWGISVTGNASTDVVFGNCLADAPYQVEVLRRDGNLAFFGQTGSSGQQGRLIADLGGHLDLRRGDQLRLTCRGAEGDYYSATGTVSPGWVTSRERTGRPGTP